MILILIILWSLCAIYITHLLSKNNFKIATKAVCVLYTTIIVWTYIVFVFDVVKLGFKESNVAHLIGSNVFHSFTSLCELTSAMPIGLHKATASVAILVAACVIIALVFSGVRIYKEIVQSFKNKIKAEKIEEVVLILLTPLMFFARKIHILHCRLND